MKFLIKFFIRGLLVVLPFVLTLYFLIWFFKGVENLFKDLLKNTIGLDFYFPGVGFIIATLVITALGVLMSSLIAQKVYAYFQKIISKLPILKTIYFAIEDFLGFFTTTESEKNFKKVVLVEIPNTGFKSVGIITNSSPNEILENKSGDLIAVYFPMSYQMGGYTLFIQKKWIEETNFSVEDAMKMAMTGWVQKK